MTPEIITKRLSSAGYQYTESRNNNNTGYAIKVNNGCIIILYDSGKLVYQGKNIDPIKNIIDGNNVINTSGNKIFVVYGHDHVARNELEAMLRRWDLEPLILDQLATSGMTIIEKLEEYINQAQFGIVLATPDDYGYPKDNEGQKKFRVRQNVVLELGMLLSKLGRKKVAILLKNIQEMEKPSDIDGLIYIPFTDKVEETTVNLVRELSRNGYHIDNAKL